MAVTYIISPWLPFSLHFSKRDFGKNLRFPFDALPLRDFSRCFLLFCIWKFNWSKMYLWMFKCSSTESRLCLCRPSRLPWFRKDNKGMINWKQINVAYLIFKSLNLLVANLDWSILTWMFQHTHHGLSPQMNITGRRSCFSWVYIQYVSLFIQKCCTI